MEKEKTSLARTQRKVILGEVGERLIRVIFKRLGKTVKFSDDPGDSRQDLFIDGVPAEIKLQTLYYYCRILPDEPPFRAFTIPVQAQHDRLAVCQLSKVQNVPEWYIVQNPLRRFNEKTIKIWKAKPPGKRPFQLTTNRHDGRIIAAFPQSNFDLFAEIDDEKLLKIFQTYNVCSWS